MNIILNNIRLAWNLTYILRTCNLTIRFLKYIAMLICLVKVETLGYN